MSTTEILFVICLSLWFLVMWLVVQWRRAASPMPQPRREPRADAAPEWDADDPEIDEGCKRDFLFNINTILIWTGYHHRYKRLQIVLGIFRLLGWGKPDWFDQNWQAVQKRTQNPEAPHE